MQLPTLNTSKVLQKYSPKPCTVLILISVFGGVVKQDRFIFRYLTKIRFRARYQFPGKRARPRRWEWHKNMAVEVKNVRAHCYSARIATAHANSHATSYIERAR